MTTATGGGCADGAAVHVISGSTWHCSCGTSYSIDGGHLVFCGHGPYGREFALIMRSFRNEEILREALAEAGRPRGCRSCGRTYADLAAFTIAHDPNWPGCVPPEIAGLTEVDGVWMTYAAAEGH